MKNLILTLVSLIALSASSFAQYPSWLNVETVRSNFPSSQLPSMPDVSYSIPSIPSYTTVNSYTRSNGTVVESHVRSMPNSTNWDNFSTMGNSNPFTGSTGYRARDYSSSAYNYGSGHTIHTGSRGGQYYYNSNGNKTYVPKRRMW